MIGELYANLSIAEGDDPSYAMDFNSNGFQIKTSANSSNANGGTYIYMAFADTDVITHDINITEKDTFQTETWDISGIVNADKDAIENISFKVTGETTADYFNTVTYTGNG